MKNLISMTDFVITQWSINLTKKQRERIKNYANFLKQPLGLWMFVPCDEDGNVLEEPYNYINFINEVELNENLEKCCIKYQKAKERCLFEGFTEKDAKFVLIANETIEELIEFNLQLTKTALKQLSL